MARDGTAEAARASQEHTLNNSSALANVLDEPVGGNVQQQLALALQYNKVLRVQNDALTHEVHGLERQLAATLDMLHSLLGQRAERSESRPLSFATRSQLAIPPHDPSPPRVTEYTDVSPERIARAVDEGGRLRALRDIFDARERYWAGRT